MTGADHPLTLPQAVQLGSAHVQAGRLAEAETIFRQVLAADPHNLSLLETLGCISHRAGKFDQALAFFDRAIQLHPQDAGVRFNKGVALEAQNRWQAAEAAYREALARDSNLAMARGNLGVVLHKLGRYDQAAAQLRRSLALNPGNARTHNNLGLTLRHLERLQEARAAHEAALRLAPDFAEAHNDLGTVLQDLGRLEEAEVCYRKARQLKPELVRAQWNLSALLLPRGEWAEGLALYEQRFAGGDETEFARPRQILDELAGVPCWSGDDLQGRRLLVWAEQGAGDGIMMARYLPLLQDKGAGALMVACRAGLKRLIQTLPGISQVRGDGTPLPLAAVDCHCPLMSLPYLFGTRVDTVPDQVPYLHVPPAVSEGWARRLADLPGLKVGLAWAGSTALRDDHLRSIAFEGLSPLLSVPGVQFVALQKDRAASHPALADWMAECHDFLDTAALIQQLDLVISVDTAVAHLAGALARPVWLLDRHAGDWRWLRGREDSPWYPTMRIFRQPQRGDWDSVIARVVEALRLMGRTQ